MNIKTFPLVMDKETHKKYSDHAEKEKKSLKAWIFDAMEEKLQREKEKRA